VKTATQIKDKIKNLAKEKQIDPLMFEARSISIWAYNLETVLAEKYHGLLSFGTYNTRMRDYYDIHILLHATMHPTDPDILANAIYQTAKQRQGEHLLARQNITLKEIFESAETKSYFDNSVFVWYYICTESRRYSHEYQSKRRHTTHFLY